MVDGIPLEQGAMEELLRRTDIPLASCPMSVWLEARRMEFSSGSLVAPNDRVLALMHGCSYRSSQFT